MKTLKIGQPLYVILSGLYTYFESDILEYTITSMNSKSLYATKQGDKQGVIRLNRKTLTNHDVLGFGYRAYLTKEEIIENRRKEKEVIMSKQFIENNLKHLSREQIIELKEFIESLID